MGYSWVVPFNWAILMMLSTAYDVYNNSDLVRFCLYLTENKKDLKLKILKMTCDEALTFCLRVVFIESLYSLYRGRKKSGLSLQEKQSSDLYIIRLLL